MHTEKDASCHVCKPLVVRASIVNQNTQAFTGAPIVNPKSKKKLNPRKECYTV